MKKYHLCLSVRGALLWPSSEIRRAIGPKGWIKHDDGSPFRTPEELKRALMDELAQGHEVIPMDKECNNFDFKHGCLSHEEGKENAKSEAQQF
jgi:hypothetical protein